MANIFEFLSKDGNITPEKARKSRQMPFHDKTAYVWMGMLPLKKRVNRDKCSFATKQRMFGVFAIDEILRYRWTRFVGSRTLCHPDDDIDVSFGVWLVLLMIIWHLVPNPSTTSTASIDEHGLPRAVDQPWCWFHYNILLLAMVLALSWCSSSLKNNREWIK